MERWSVGALERLERWSVGALERWSVGALERWSVIKFSVLFKACQVFFIFFSSIINAKNSQSSDNIISSVHHFCNIQKNKMIIRLNYSTLILQGV